MSRADLLVETRHTDDVPQHHRTEYWRSLASSYHCLIGGHYPNGDDFRGEAVRESTDRYQLIGWRSDAAVYHRTANHIRQGTDENYRLVLPMAGGIALRQHNQQVRLNPGMAGLMTMSEPFVMSHGSATHSLVLTIPRREIDHRLNRSAPLASALNLTSGLGRVVSALFTSLYQERSSLTHQQFNAVSDRLVELLCMLLLGDNRVADNGSLREVEAAVRGYVREHADDPHLEPHVVARALGWSLRQVQLALQKVGTTPRALIKEERLLLARERLQNPAYQHWSVTDLAGQLGFSSVSTFSTAFRQRFGHRPSDLRRVS